MSRDSNADLVHRYAVVRRDGEQWRNRWAENAEWNLGPGCGAPDPSGDFLNVINPE